MTDLSVALIAASDSKVFGVPVQYTRDNSSEFIPKLNHDRTNVLTYGTNAARRAVRVHSALATVLVSQPSDEVIAVGAARSEDGLLTIYISSSGEKSSLSTLNKARLHLENVCERLGSLVDEHPQQGSDTPQELELSSDKVLDLILCIYRHAMSNVIERFKKGDELGVRGFITEAVGAPSAYVKEEAPKSREKAYILRSELDMLESLQTVLIVLSAYQEKRSEENLKNFIATTDAVCEEVDALGDSVWSETSESLFSRCDQLMKERINTKLTKPAAFARFWKKAFALHHAIKQVLYLTASSTMRSQLKGPFAVEIVPPRDGPFQYDLSDDTFRAVFGRVPHGSITRLKPHESLTGLAIQSDSSSGSLMDISSEESSNRSTGSSESENPQFTYDKFIARYCAKRSLRECKTVHVHCELALLTYFLTEKIDAFGFIAVSKLCCLGCWFYFLAHNEVAERNGERLYHILGTHSKAYYGWIKPTLDATSDQEIEGALSNNAEIHFASIKKQFEPRKWSDSTTASSGVVKIRALAQYMEPSGGKKGFLRDMRRMNLLQE
ncbi:hypothetical protein ACEPAI_2980 [Sanghuangporus weigelae]